MDDLGLPQTGGINQWSIRKLIVFRIWNHPFFGVHKLNIWWARSARTSAWLSTNEKNIFGARTVQGLYHWTSLGNYLGPLFGHFRHLNLIWNFHLENRTSSLRMFVLFVGIRVDASPQWHQYHVGNPAANLSKEGMVCILWWFLRWFIIGFTAFPCSLLQYFSVHSRSNRKAAPRRQAGLRPFSSVGVASCDEPGGDQPEKNDPRTGSG